MMIRTRLTPAALLCLCALPTAAMAHSTQQLASLTDATLTDHTVRITLGDRAYDLLAMSVSEHESVGATSVRGQAGDSGSFVLASGPVGIEGCVWIDGQAWTIRARHGDLSPTISMSDIQNETCAGALSTRPPNPEREPVLIEDDRAAPARGGDNPINTRILIVYDQIAESSVADMAAHAAALVESANTSYANSDISVLRLELAGIQEVENRPTGDSGITLRQLTNRYDTTFDIVHSVRDALDADIVAHLTDLSGVCGRGWLSPDNSGFAFSTTDINCGLSNLSFAHEVGHNQGCAHDPDNAGSSYASYGFGHRWDSNRYRSVMSYSPGSRLMYFSNPDVLHNGFPTGIANQRDNARVLESTSLGIANNRVGDGTGLDCDTNGTPDDLEIARDGSLDLDRNGELDACQIIANPALDCNGDGVLDAYQAQPRASVSLGIADAFGSGVAPSFSAPAPLPESVGEVEVIVSAYGDLGTSSEYITLSFNNGAFAADIFRSSGSDCLSSGQRESFTIDAATFNMLNDAGLSVIANPSSAVDSGVCSYTHLEITLDYRSSNGSLDANGDGIIDTCACPADLSGDGNLNFFDVTMFIEAYNNQNPIADFNGDSAFDFFDVTGFIVSYNGGCP